MGARFGNLVRLKHGCPNHCYITKRYKSGAEHEIVSYIKGQYSQLTIQQSVRDIIKNPEQTKWMELDIYIPELHLAFEFNGTYWHSNRMVQQRYKGRFTSPQALHDYKTGQCAQKGVKLVHIAEAEYVADRQKVLDTIAHEVESALKAQSVLANVS